MTETPHSAREYSDKLLLKLLQQDTALLDADAVQASWDKSELDIIMAECGHQHDRLKTSIDNVNQSLTLYLASLAVIGTVISILLSSWSPQNYVGSLLLAMLMFVASMATYFTFLRTYKARIEQTEADRALSRLRNYIISTRPGLQPYISGECYDDWPTPYTHRWQSATFFGWLALIFVAALLAALAVVALILALSVVYRIEYWYVLPFTVWLGVFFFLYRWLTARLDYKTRMDRPRFPRPKP